jgi:hypothetical protein
LYTRIIDRQINEEEARFAFSEYTQVIIDLALGEVDLIGTLEQGKGLADVQWGRIFHFKRTLGYQLQLLVPTPAIPLAEGREGKEGGEWREFPDGRVGHSTVEVSQRHPIR